MTDQIPTKKKKGEKASKLDENGANKVSKQIELVEIKQEQEAIEEEAEIEEELEMEVNDKKGDLVIKNEDFTLDLFEEEKEIEPHSSAAPQQFFKRRGFNRKRKDFSGSAMDNFDTEQFIIEIQSRPSIWDASSADYPNRDLRKKCWEEVVELFGGENLSAREERDLGEACKRKWKNIRDSYRKYLKEMISKSGDGYSIYSKIKRYKYAKMLEFLKPYLQDISSNVNFLEESLDAQQDEVTNQSEIMDDEENRDVQEEEPEEEPVKAVESTAFQRKRKVRQEEEKAVESTALQRTRKLRQEQESSSNLLVTYIREKQKLKKQKDSDALKQLFMSMYNTVKMFPPTLQAEIKLKLFNVISEAELAHLRNESSAVSTPITSPFSSCTSPAPLHPEYLE